MTTLPFLRVVSGTFVLRSEFFASWLSQEVVVAFPSLCPIPLLVVNETDECWWIIKNNELNLIYGWMDSFRNGKDGFQEV